MEIEEIAERAERGENVSAYFTGQHRVKQRVNVDFPLALLRQVDAECQLLGITRQAWTKPRWRAMSGFARLKATYGRDEILKRQVEMETHHDPQQKTSFLKAS